MKKIAIKVDNEAEAKALSLQMKRLEPRWLYNGSTTKTAYYIIFFDEISFKPTDFNCTSIEEKEAKLVEYSTCEFFELPSQIQDKIIELSESKSYIPFVKDIGTTNGNGGFRWDRTEEGHTFWKKVLIEKNFQLFFEHFNTKKDENRLCKKDPIVSGDSRGWTAGICCRRHKITITVNNLSNKAVIGRG